MAPKIIIPLSSAGVGYAANVQARESAEPRILNVLRGFAPQRSSVPLLATGSRWIDVVLMGVSAAYLEVIGYPSIIPFLVAPRIEPT